MMVSPGGTAWYGAGWLFVISMITSLMWYLFWLVMVPVKLDIVDPVNWYFFMKLNLSQQYDFYSLFEVIHNWCPLLIILSFILSKVAVIYRDYLIKGSQVLYIAVIVYNLAFLFALVFAGGLVIQLFQLTLPLYVLLHFGPFLSYYFSPCTLWLPTTFFLLVYYMLCCRHAPPPSENRTQRYYGSCTPSLMGATKRVLATFFLPISLTLLTYWVMESGCLPCISKRGFNVYPKPDLISHRGCGFDAPENTLAAFQESCNIPGIVGLETDVYVSMDGVLYLLHDPHLVRTTDVSFKCPSHDKHMNSSFLYYYNGSCPLNTLNVGERFVKSNKGKLTRDEISRFNTQKIPTFREFLEIAKSRDKSVIFDLSEPPLAHPHRETYLNKTLSAIRASGISLNKVWWLPVDRRTWIYNAYPDMILTTKTKDTSFEDLEKEHILKINDDWSTSLWLLRDYQEANLSINMFFVDSPFMYSYAWCVGVQTVTTNNCKILSSINSNLFLKICRNWHFHYSYPHYAMLGGMGVVILEVIAVVCWEFYRTTGHYRR